MFSRYVKPFFRIFCLCSLITGSLYAQSYPPAPPQLEQEDSEAFFPKRRSLNRAIERNQAEQERLNEDAYPH